MNAKEQWIKDVENSLKGLKAVEPNPYLFSKILNRMEQKQTNKSPAKLLWWALSSLVILTLLNLFVLREINNSKTNKTYDVQILSEQFELLNTNPINYN